MTRNIKNLMVSAAIFAVLTGGGATIASASQVTGTLTSTGGSSTSGTSTVTGTLTGGTGTGSAATGTISGTSGPIGTISGTVTGGSTGGSSSSGGGSSGGGGGGGGGGNGPIVGSSGTGPQGQVLGASTGPIGLGSTEPSVPGSPDTGAGGNAPMNVAMLTLTGLLVCSGMTMLLWKRKTA